MKIRCINREAYRINIHTKEGKDRRIDESTEKRSIRRRIFVHGRPRLIMDVIRQDVPNKFSFSNPSTLPRLPAVDSRAGK